MEGTIGTVLPWAPNFAPRSWAFCDGQLLPISQFDALFSIVGTIYGGDGENTFGLPDLRGRVAVHEGTGPGLPPVRLGEKFGNETTRLTVAQLPAHSHAPPSPGIEAADAQADQAGPEATRRLARPNLAFGSVNAYSTASDTTLGGLALTGALSAAAVGAGQAHSEMQPYLVLHYIICIQGIYPSFP